MLLLRWAFPRVGGWGAFALYGLIPLAAGAAAVAILPISREEEWVAMALYLAVMGALLALQVPIMLMIACRLGAGCV
jgi:hypothetical protein